MKRFVIAGAVLAMAPVAAWPDTLQDRTFVQGTGHIDLVSMQEGQNAATSATNPAVRAFGQKEVPYHTEEDRTVSAMLPPGPPTTTPCMTWQARLVQETPAPQFDGAYLTATISNHKRLIEVMQGEIQAGTDPNMIAYAQKTLPILQAHLAEAEQLLNGAPVARALPSPITVRPNFASGAYSLAPADQQVLNDFVQRLTGVEQVTVTATGYTDTVPIGPDLKREGIPTNEVLSEKRADSVKQYLVSKGLRADEIETRGMGPANPIASNDTAAGRAQNRRVAVAVANATARGATTPAVVGATMVNGIPACEE